MKKKFLLTISLLFFTAFLLIGCSGESNEGSGEGTSEGSGEKQTLTIYTVAGGDEYYNEIVIPMFEEKTNGKYNIEYGRGTPQEIINKIKAQGANGNIDIVITGLDGLPIGIEEGLWEQLVPEYGDYVHVDEWNEIAQAYIDKFDGYGVPITTGSGGPILVYNSETVDNPPSTYEELKEWIKENPGRFLYPAVPSSGPARGFFFGLVHALGEDYNDPDSLEKTWEYLEEIDPYIDMYPSKTSDAFDLLYEGAVDIVPHVPFWFGDNVAVGIVPPHIKGIKFTDTKQIIDSHFYVMIKDLPEERKEAALEFLEFATSKEVMAQGYVRGFLPANGLATPDMLLDEYHESYQNLVEAVMPEFKDGDRLYVPEDDWMLFPDLDATKQLYTEWEERIQANK